ncbi:hypothetical protein [Streptomyces sp. NRRL WC-3742]|uniref:hypothetical protein n=1 Tax=Streptomyces sp. NRRL WC-3742 TaxID=1463934 RepID=UPI0004CBBD4B|nr:hypothetical protein [Streptomyces sp. NRRL WC-3742]
MTKRSPGSTAQLRQGTQDLLQRRGMASTPSRLGPQPGTGIGAHASAGPVGADAFRHGGRDTATSAMHAAPAMHAELKGHRHRGAEKHSAH